MRYPMKKKYDQNRICQECRMELNDVAEYHPLSFCQLYQLGYNPWQFLADVLWARGWKAQSVNILDRFTVRNMNLKVAARVPKAT